MYELRDILSKRNEGRITRTFLVLVSSCENTRCNKNKGDSISKPGYQRNSISKTVYQGRFDVENQADASLDKNSVLDKNSFLDK